MLIQQPIMVFNMKTQILGLCSWERAQKICDQIFPEDKSGYPKNHSPPRKLSPHPTYLHIIIFYQYFICL